MGVLDQEVSGVFNTIGLSPDKSLDAKGGVLAAYARKRTTLCPIFT